MADTVVPSNHSPYAFSAREADFVADPATASRRQAEIRRTLAANAEVGMTYRSLDQAACKFGADAR